MKNKFYFCISFVCLGLKSSGTISFLHQSDRGIHPQTEFVFDLELSEHFQPCNMDGEVSEWHLVPAKEVIDLLCSEVRLPLHPYRLTLSYAAPYY
jgi:hypothetical protein